MFEKILRFFIHNSRLNYLLFVLVFITGVILYMKTPKEIFPSFELDMISVNGHYNGASIDMLNHMAVKEIESGLKNIDGIEKMSTIISAGKFTIVLELEKRVNKYNIAEKVQAVVSLMKAYLPSDMDEPTVNVLDIKRNLMRIAISSHTRSHGELIVAGDRLKEQINHLKNIAEVELFGNSELYYDIRLHNDKIQVLGLDENAVISALLGLSYIFPIGTIDDQAQGTLLYLYL
ncbi:MAG: efflux RND transporter permease subunit [Sulfurovum sp.]|nr:efflux RND transporter permease subunit [Sulfurovum sp.]